MLTVQLQIRLRSGSVLLQGSEPDACLSSQPPPPLVWGGAEWRGGLLEVGQGSGRAWELCGLPTAKTVPCPLYLPEGHSGSGRRKLPAAHNTSWGPEGWTKGQSLSSESEHSLHLSWTPPHHQAVEGGNRVCV